MRTPVIFELLQGGLAKNILTKYKRGTTLQAIGMPESSFGSGKAHSSPAIVCNRDLNSLSYKIVINVPVLFRIKPEENKKKTTIDFNKDNILQLNENNNRRQSDSAEAPRGQDMGRQSQGLRSVSSEQIGSAEYNISIRPASWA